MSDTQQSPVAEVSIFTARRRGSLLTPRLIVPAGGIAGVVQWSAADCNAVAGISSAQEEARGDGPEVTYRLCKMQGCVEREPAERAEVKTS